MTNLSQNTSLKLEKLSPEPSVSPTIEKRCTHTRFTNSFVLNATFLYPSKISENRKVRGRVRWKRIG